MSSSDGKEHQYLLAEMKYGRRKRLALGVIVVSDMFAVCCISLIGPFFPIEAATKGTSDTVIGFIFSCPELVIFLSSPIIAKMDLSEKKTNREHRWITGDIVSAGLLSRYSPKFFYISGLCLFGLCYVIFGLLNKLPSGVIFISACFTVRIVQATGTAALLTASFTIAGSNFPDKTGTVFGILETATGLGFMFGPAAGGGLFQLGGYGLPFWVLGGCVFICGCVSCAVLPPQEHVEESTGPTSLTLLRSPLACYGCLCLVAGTIGFSLWNPLLADHLLQFNISQSVIGLIFLVLPCVYSLTSPIWGLLLDKQVPAIPMVTVGLCCTAVNMLFYGPAPFFTFVRPMLWLSILSTALTGLTMAPVIVSAMRCVVLGASDLGFKEDRSTFGLVGGAVMSSNSLGLFIGPSVGGTLADHFGFRWALTTCAFLMLLPVICFSPFLALSIYRRFTKDKRQT